MHLSVYRKDTAREEESSPSTLDPCSNLKLYFCTFGHALAASTLHGNINTLSAC